MSVRAAHGDESKLVPNGTTKTTINVLFQRAAYKAPALPEAEGPGLCRGRDVGVIIAPAWDSFLTVRSFNPSGPRLRTSVFNFRPPSGQIRLTLVVECITPH